MLARLLHSAIYLVAATVMGGLAAGGAWLVYLGIMHSPPYGLWATQGIVGVLAAGILGLGTFLWAALTISAIIWLERCVRTAVVVLIRAEG